MNAPSADLSQFRMDAEPVVPLSVHDFDRLREYVYRRTGIQFGPNKRYFVDKRVQAMMVKFGTQDFGTYFSALRVGNELLIEQLVNALTVNETYFLREDYQFDALVRSVLPLLMSERSERGIAGQPVRILSLPSSTGEEPYSIAIRLLEDWPDIDRIDVNLTAGDIDTRVLADARAGVYSGRSVQRVPLALLGKYFVSRPAGNYQIVDDLRQSVTFQQINICDHHSMSAHLNYDVIFCRNLLIYFDDVSSRAAVDNLFSALRPGGFLFLGHSESMSRISSIFTPLRFPEAHLYQRPYRGERR